MWRSSLLGHLPYPVNALCPKEDCIASPPLVDQVYHTHESCFVIFSLWGILSKAISLYYLLRHYIGNEHAALTMGISLAVRA